METTFGAFLTLMSVGALWQFFPSLPDRSAIRSAISAIVLNVFLPALSFHVLYSAPLNAELWIVPTVSALTCLATLGAAWLVYRALFELSKGRFSKAAMGALLLGAAWSNATYLGLPTVTLLVGEDYARVPILYDLLAITPLLLTLGASIGALCGESNYKTDLTSSLLSIAKLPPLWAAMLGVLLNALRAPVPEVLLSACKLAGSAVAPVMIFSVGLALRISSPKTLAWILPALVLKLLFSPTVAYLVAQSLGLSGKAFAATVLEAAMPTMVLTMVIADKFKLDSELLAQNIAASTALSFLTIPALWRALN
ncbi:MAG: AEC family transporter [Chloroherpetonaceae bacterium]|nr:AEC family transporter [Chloroherpetonaceae bacterium]MDW8436723.1 AEC family transporter [Chloroherpetonaceae bacterium]